MTAQERAVEIGSASLTGMRGRVAKSVAKPIARRTGLSREQVEAIIGFLILAYGIYQVVRPLYASLAARIEHRLTFAWNFVRRDRIAAASLRAQHSLNAWPSSSGIHTGSRPARILLDTEEVRVL